MAETQTTLRIRSYNINGFDNSKECLYQDCEDAAFDILAMQEHWLRPSFKKEKGINKIKTLHQHFDGFATSGMNSQIGKTIMKGRPFGGTGFLFSKKLSKCLRARVDIKHERVTVMELNTQKHQILLINAYLPYFISSSNDAQIAEYRQTLAFLQTIMHSHPNHKFILLMDMNCNIFNFSHPCSSLICGMMKDYDLVSNYSFINDFNQETEYTRFDLKKKSFTLIDGILLSKCLSNIVSSSSIIHPHLNTSDHLPVELTIDVNVENFDFKKSQVTYFIPWKTLSDSELSHYRESMKNALCSISVPFHALNHNGEICENCDCLVALENFYEDIVSAVRIADQTLPRRRHGLAKPFWSPKLNDLKNKSFEAHKLWVNCDRPRSGPIYTEKICTNSQYKLLLRKSKRDTNSKITNELADNLLQKDNHSFWKNWNRLKKGHGDSSTMINGCISHDDIANTFADYFKSVYTKSNADDKLKTKFENTYIMITV